MQRRVNQPCMVKLELYMHGADRLGAVLLHWQELTQGAQQFLMIHDTP